jgi:hypothetical protein
MNKPIRICSVEGCVGKHLANGLCRKHYHKEYNAKPEYKAYLKEYNKERNAKPEYKAYKKTYMKEYEKGYRKEYVKERCKTDPAFRLMHNLRTRGY